MDYSFLKLYNSIEQAVNDNEFNSSQLLYYIPIQLSPNETYSQKTNFDGGISLSSDFNTYVVDVDGNILNEITPNVFTEEFIDQNGNTQVKIEIINIGFDYYGRTVFIKIDENNSNVDYFTRPIRITNKDLDRTLRFDYYGLSNKEGLSYVESGFKQSIRLRCELSDIINNSEVGEYYQISNGNTISTRPLKKLQKSFIIENFDIFTFYRFQELLFHDIIYVDGIRLTDKPIIESGGRIGRTNMIKGSFNAYFNDNDAYTYEYQIFQGLQITAFEPTGNTIICGTLTQIVYTFNINVILQNGNVNVFDSESTLIHSFNQSDMSVIDNQLIVDTAGTPLENPAFGLYYVNITNGLVLSVLGEENEAINFDLQYSFTISEGQFNRLQFNNNQFLVNCATEPNPLVDNLVLAYYFNETTGTTAIDSSTLSNNGTIINAVINQVGLVDRCYEFNNGATNQYVTIPNNASLNLGNDSFSIEIWINPSATFGNILNKYNISTGDLEYRLFLQSNVLQFFTYTDSANRLGVADNVSLTISAWNQVFITYDGTDLLMRVNNVASSFPYSEFGTYTGMPNTSQPMILGQQAEDLTGVNRFSGLQDIFRIWKGYTVTPTEITTLYNSGNGTETL